MALIFADSPFFTEADRALDRAMRSMLSNEPCNTFSNFVKINATRHAFDVMETPDALKVVADAPGFTPEDIMVELHEGRLTIRGEHKIESQTSQDGKYRIQERQFSTFTRQFQLPGNIMEDNIAANLDKGVLTITVPKKPQPPKPEPKRIIISDNSRVVNYCKGTCITSRR